MATTKRLYILATCFLSAIAAIISLIALGTEQWVVADGKWVEAESAELDKIEYGLFNGVKRQKYGTVTTFELTMTCLFGDNVCAMLCGVDDETRRSILENLVKGDIPANYFDEYIASCVGVEKVLAVHNEPMPRASAPSVDRSFINAGVYVSTLLFICLSALMGLISAGLAIWNTASNPVEVYFSVTGLFIYNAIALCSTLIYILLFGIMFAVTLINNVALFETITGIVSTEGRAQLGYSYWINMVTLVCYCGSLVLLYLREYFINKDPPADIHLEDTADTALYLY